MDPNIKIIDFHSHILPRADHGSSGLGETREQLALINKFGVDTVVATPHFYPNSHSLNAFVEMIDSSAEEFISIDSPRPALCIGAEVLYCEGLENMDGLDKLCIRGTDVLLLELPLDSWGTELFYTVDELTKRYTVVLAHIDRYIRAQADEIEELVEMGALAQINASSLFSFGEKRKLEPFIQNGLIWAIGSDLHNLEKKSYRQFHDAQKKLGDEYSRIMSRSASLLKDAKLY